MICLHYDYNNNFSKILQKKKKEKELFKQRKLIIQENDKFEKFVKN